MVFCFFIISKGVQRQNKHWAHRAEFKKIKRLVYFSQADKTAADVLHSANTHHDTEAPSEKR